jgi:hypothetical protein
MSKDLKDIINTVEEETKSHAELEAIINSLHEEINQLNGIINEQKRLINEQSDSTTFDVSSIPSEVDILKDLVISQRQKLVKKDETNERLNDKIDELTLKIKKSKNGIFTSQDNEDLIQAQELIFAFTEESENFRNQIEELKSQIKGMKSEKSEFEATNQEHMEESEEMVNIKRLNFQLMEENGLLRVEIESVKVQLQERTEELSSEELLLAYQKIEALALELDDYEAQVRYLQQKLETDVVPPVNLTYTTDEFNNLKEELSTYQNENQRLNNILLELDHSHTSQLSESEYKSVVFNFPKQFQISLFKKMYNLLDDIDKRAIINALIKDLDTRNNDVKRAILKILGEIRHEKVYEAFLDLLHDEDWVIRYNVIKALTKFGFDDKTFKDLLKKLTNDIDIDVRELAMKVLIDMS